MDEDVGVGDCPICSTKNCLAMIYREMDGKFYFACSKCGKSWSIKCRSRRSKYLKVRTY